MSENQLRKFIQRLRNNNPSLIALDFHYINGELGPYPLLGGEKLFQELLEALCSNETVRSVNISLRFLLGMSEEEKIRLYRGLGSLPMLKNLEMSSSGLTGLGLKVVTEALHCAQNLVSLAINSIHFRDTVYYRSFGTINSGNGDFLEFCNALRGLGKLESVSLVDVEDCFDLNALANSLSTLSALKHLSIKAFAFSFLSEPRLSRNSLLALARSPTLQTLSLKRLQLARFLPEVLFSLQNNRTLKSLSLEGYQMDRDCGFALAQLLQINQTLQDVHVGYNTLPDDCGVAIANALTNNRAIQVFDFSANNLERKSSFAFRDLLMSNTSSLVYLNLASNRLQDDGCIVLALALRSNEILKSLVLSQTQMTDVSCVTLSTALEMNSCLERLDLSGNSIFDHGGVALGQTLKINTSLKSLNLAANHLGDIGVITIAMSLQTSNSTLEELNLASNHNAGVPSFEALETMIEHNIVLDALWTPTVIPTKSTIPSFLKLNQLGRRRLLQEMENAKLWIDVITKCVDDIHGLHYLVRANPALCSHGKH